MMEDNFLIHSPFDMIATRNSGTYYVYLNQFSPSMDHCLQSRLVIQRASSPGSCHCRDQVELLRETVTRLRVIITYKFASCGGHGGVLPIIGWSYAGNDVAYALLDSSNKLYRSRCVITKQPLRIRTSH